MTRSMVRLAAILFFAWAAAARADVPSTVSATYEVRMNGINVAVVNETYEGRDGSYRLTSASMPLGIFALVQKLAVRFESTGDITAQGLRPQRFEGRRASGSSPEVVADFDWKAPRLTLTHNGRTETVALPPGTQDRLSVMYEFMFRLPRVKQSMQVTVTNGRNVSDYTYTVTRDVEQDTPLGRLKTVHLVRQRGPGDGENEIWLSPDHGYVPVRMIIVERDGTRYEQLASRLDLQP